MCSIYRLETQERIMENYSNYRHLAWAECLIKLMNYYGTKIKYIRMAAFGDIYKLAKLCQEHKLNFWSRVFEEYDTFF